APVYHKPYTEPERIQAFKKLDPYKPDITDTEETLKQLMQQPTVASKKSIFETYDSMVRTNTVVGPGSDAAVLRIRGTRKALAMTTDCNARYLYLDPEKGGQMAVAEAARNIVASGGEPLAITDCLNYGNPDKPEVFWELWTSADPHRLPRRDRPFAGVHGGGAALHPARQRCGGAPDRPCHGKWRPERQCDPSRKNDSG
ncbi:MAG: hypothetical protein B7Z25_02310, partial [Aerococcus viridans]